MYKLFNDKQIYEKDEVDSAIAGVVSTATNAYNKADEANTKANAALAETDRIEGAYNMAEQAFNKMDTYDTAINETLTASANATTLAIAASERSLDAKEKAELAYARVPIKYVDELPTSPIDMLYGIRNTTPVTESRTTTFVDIIGTYFRTQSAGKYVLKDEYEITVGGASFGSVYVSKETVYCYTSRNFTGMLPTTYNTYDQYVFVITEQVDRIDYYAGNAIAGTFTQLAGFDLVINGYIQRTEKGAPGGVATLDTEGHILYSQLPVNATVFRGTWDASTGEYPTEHVTPGDFFIVNVAGEVDGIQYLVDDRLYWTGEGWNVTHAPEGVISINGKKGEVALTAADLGALPVSNPAYTGTLTGENCTAARNGAALGTGTTAGDDQFAIGSYNHQDTANWVFMVGNGSGNDLINRRNAMGVTKDGVLYVHDIRCVYGNTLQKAEGGYGVLTGHTYVYNSDASGHDSVSHIMDNHETFTLILQTVPASKLVIRCRTSPDAGGGHDRAYDVHNINILNLTDSTVTIYVSTSNAEGTGKESNVSLPAKTKKSVVAIENTLYDLNIPNAIWN